MRARAAVALAAAALGLAAACGRAPEPALARAVELAPAGDAPDDAPPAVVVERFEPTAGLAPWDADAKRWRVDPEPGGSGALALFLFGDEERTVTIPATLDPARFNQVAVAITGQFRSTLAVRLERDDGTSRASPRALLRASATPQRVIASFASNAEETRPFDRLVLSIAAGAGPVCVHAIELVAMPRESWVASAPGELVRIGDEARPAVLLTSRRPLVGTFDRRNGEDLVLSCALEPELRLAGQKPTIDVTVTGARGTTRWMTVEMEGDPAEPARWRDLALGLPWLDGPVELRVELNVEGEAEGFAWIGPVRVVRRAETAPTVLLVTSDTHRADHLGLLAAPGELATPALDALAARGVCFENAFSAAEITLPSHTAILSGHTPRDTRITNNHTRLDAGVHTLAERFEDAGWRTFAVVSARHLADDISGLGQGFERLAHPAGEERAERTVERALAWLEGVEGEPVFLWVHVFDAHTPYEAPDEVTRPYVERAERSAGAQAPDLEHERQRARYKGEITWLDRALGRLLEVERVRDGIVAFTSDHGEAHGECGIHFTHEELYATTLHVPLIVAWPSAPAGRRVATPVTNVDVGRTLLELARVPAGDHPGRSLVGALEGGADRGPVFAISYAGRSASITSGTLHAILHLEAHEVGKPEPRREVERHQLELYDLAKDPACEHDLASARPDDARRLREALIAWLQDARPISAGTNVELSAADQAHLAAMGYATDTTSSTDAEWFDASCECAPCARWTR